MATTVTGGTARTKLFSIYLVEKGAQSVRVLGRNKADAIESSGLKQRDGTDAKPTIRILKKNIEVDFVLYCDGTIRGYECSDEFAIISNETKLYFYPSI